MEVNEVNFDYGEFYDGWSEFAVDDITGAQLPVDLVRAARREEMHHMLSRTVEIVKTAEAYEKTGKGPSPRSGWTLTSLTVWARCLSGQGG